MAGYSEVELGLLTQCSKLCYHDILFNLNCGISFQALYAVISNSNWTEWSTIQAVIGRVISKSAEREAQGRFEIRARLLPELYDTKSNY